MALPSSGPIGGEDINLELGRAYNEPFSLNGTQERLLAGKPGSGTPINFSDFHGKSASSGVVETFTLVSFRSVNPGGEYTGPGGINAGYSNAGGSVSKNPVRHGTIRQLAVTTLGTTATTGAFLLILVGEVSEAMLESIEIVGFGTFTRGQTSARGGSYSFTSSSADSRWIWGDDFGLSGSEPFLTDGATYTVIITWSQ